MLSHLSLTAIKSSDRVQGFAEKANHIFARFEEGLRDGKEYLFGAKPTVADFFLFAAIDVYTSAFGWDQFRSRFPVLVLNLDRHLD